MLEPYLLSAGDDVSRSSTPLAKVLSRRATGGKLQRRPIVNRALVGSACQARCGKPQRRVVLAACGKHDILPAYGAAAHQAQLARRVAPP